MAKAKNTDKLVVQNAAKTLLANIRFASVDDPIRTITVTSSIPNEGKSTVSINLAQAIATSGKSVLLVECRYAPQVRFPICSAFVRSRRTLCGPFRADLH